MQQYIVIPKKTQYFYKTSRVIPKKTQFLQKSIPNIPIQIVFWFSDTYKVGPPSYKLVYKPHEYYSYKYHKP